jgi:hypothetical protein
VELMRRSCVIRSAMGTISISSKSRQEVLTKRAWGSEGLKGFWESRDMLSFISSHWVEVVVVFLVMVIIAWRVGSVSQSLCLRYSVRYVWIELRA